MLKTVRKLGKRALLGVTEISQQCTIALCEPQSEVEVWLHGTGAPVNVTHRHMVACAAPSLLGIGSHPRLSAAAVLKFHAGNAQGPVLGQLELQRIGAMTTSGAGLTLYQVRGSANYCLSGPRLWSYGLFQAWLRTRNRGNHEFSITRREAGAMSVLFSCPRPVVLVSSACQGAGNMFPMNLMGSIGEDHFAFALNSRRKAAALVEKAGRVALSGIPFDRSGVARQLGKNHYRESIPWSELPFDTTPSSAFHLPVPAFASRVREVEVEAVRPLGSHTLFVGRVVEDWHYSNAPQFFMIHGLYQAWRLTASKRS